MLSLKEQQKVKDVLRQLNVRDDINMAFILDLIINSNKDISILSDKLDQVLRNQRNLADELETVLRKIG
ncbi:hypothetical protein MPAN_004560 [Mariniplasma anaerobium]|uniref:Uncharacterized protein n=1 Tax=Mariniplasma anaerobium TaxID=2735436 RepID=A0A7U9XXF2_9MOLU|nr:hypothetical protein MPAN_004560 [Mariniplasma anaerobium]